MVKDWWLYKIFRYVFRVRADMNTAKSLGNLAISLLLSNEEGIYQPNLLQLNVKNPFTDRLWGDIFWKLFFTSDNKKISCWFIYMSNFRFGILFLLNWISNNQIFSDFWRGGCFHAISLSKFTIFQSIFFD